MTNTPVTSARIQAALNAIEAMGGPLIASQKITEMTGKPCTRDRVQKWKTNGIAPPWHPIVHKLTGIPLPQLDAEIYPRYLFQA
jgi:hypothetical protein